MDDCTLRLSSTQRDEDLQALLDNPGPLESDADAAEDGENQGNQGNENAVDSEGYRELGGSGSSEIFPKSHPAEESRKCSPSEPSKAAATVGPPPHPRRRRDRDKNDPHDAARCRNSGSSGDRDVYCHQGSSSEKDSLGLLGLSSSMSRGDTTESWMRSRGSGSGGISTTTDGTLSGAGLGGGVRGGGGVSTSEGSSKSSKNAYRGFLDGRDSARFAEETASSSSATLSLQLPFSDDESALLGDFNQAFFLGAENGGGGSGAANDILGLTLQGGGGTLETLPGRVVKTRILELYEKLAHLERLRAALESQLLQERARHESHIQSLQKRWLEQIESLKESQETLELERDSIRARLTDQKDVYKDLAISEALARELRRVPEEDRTIKEYVSLKVFDLVASSKGELERTRRELEKTQEKLLASTEAGDLQRREDARARRLATAREEGLKVDVEALKERAEDMATRAREAQRAADENKDKARRFDEVEALLRTVQMELNAARALSKTQADALVDMADSEKAAARNAQDAAQRSTMLEMDKIYLKRELAEAQSRADRLGREAEAASDRLRDLERAKDAMAAELVTVRERTRTERDEKLQAEVARLREQSAKELADIRASGREVFERENQALREARKDALQEVLRVRSELSELQRAHEDLVMSVAKSDAAHETALGEVRAELRLKSFELSQLGVAHSEKCSSLRQAELEIEMLREQVTVHCGEFGELEASTTRKISELQLVLEAERDKVRAFEELELEVDGAVIRTGREMLLAEEQDHSRDRSSPSQQRASAGDSADAPAKRWSSSRRQGSSVGGSCAGIGRAEVVIPMAPQRRLRQAVLLAHKLLKKEAELDLAKGELAETQQRANALETRARKAEGLLETVEQPTRYMVDAIRCKESEIESLRATQRRLEAKVDALERTCRETAAEKTTVERELQRSLLISRRSDACSRSSDATERGPRSERRDHSPGFHDLGEAEREADPAGEAGGSPAMSPSRFGGAGEAMPSSLLSEKLTVHGGKRVSEGGPRWYSYRQSKLVRVPS